MSFASSRSAAGNDIHELDSLPARARLAAWKAQKTGNWKKISTRPTTDTAHTAVRSHGMPAI
jgi:hypothetical protein